MDDLFQESVVQGGVNVLYTLDADQLAEMGELVDAVNAVADTELAASPTVILYYADLWNLRVDGELIGDGRAQWLAFLAVGLDANGFQILILAAITDNEDFAAYWESRGLGGVANVADDIQVRWVEQNRNGEDLRSLDLKVEGDMGRIDLRITHIPLVTTTGDNPLDGIDFFARPVAHAATAFGIDNSGEQFLADLETLNYRVSFANLDLPIVVDGFASNVNEFFRGNGGVSLVRTESRFWRWWLQP